MDSWATVTKYHYRMLGASNGVPTRVEIFWLPLGFSDFTGIAAKLKFDVGSDGDEISRCVRFA